MSGGKVATPARGSAGRFLLLAALALPVAGLATLAAHALHWGIAVITRLAFYGEFSHDWTSPTEHRLGAWVILIPALGGGLIALLARFGSRAVVAAYPK